jgi:SAM-dependent methyltransferase
MQLERIKQLVANRLPRRVLLLAGRHNRGRRAVAARYLRGAGVEIGALSQPLLVPRGVRVEYVDRLSKDEALRRFPGLTEAHLVDPTHLGDGLRLDFLPDASQDFVIANHVLEHAPDPLGALLSWARVLRPGGVLFVTVPHVDHSFDRGRPVTDLAHLIEDHRLAAAGEIDALWRRSRVHYEEWVRISDVNAGAPSRPRPDDEAAARAAARLLDAREEIHFHTFTEASYRDLLGHFASTARLPMCLAEVARNRTEIIGILRREASDGAGDRGRGTGAGGMAAAAA